MIIYNVTLSINPDIESSVLSWLKDTHVPEVMSTGLFISNNMFKIVESHTVHKEHLSSIMLAMGVRMGWLTNG